MEGYRSGHNGAVLKTVRGQPHAGSNPAPSAKIPETPDVSGISSLVCHKFESILLEEHFARFASCLRARSHRDTSFKRISLPEKILIPGASGLWPSQKQPLRSFFRSGCFCVFAAFRSGSCLAILRFTPLHPVQALSSCRRRPCRRIQPRRRSGRCQ